MNFYTKCNDNSILHNKGGKDLAIPEHVWIATRAEGEKLDFFIFSEITLEMRDILHDFKA